MRSSFFRIHHNDRQILAALLLLGTITLGLLTFSDNDSDRIIAEQNNAHDSILHKRHTKEKRYYDDIDNSYSHNSNKKLFNFDPNTATAQELQLLGLRQGQIRAIMKYRQNGGLYMRKEDFARVPGLSLKDYNELSSYIHIADDYQQASLHIRTKSDSLQHANPQKLREGETIDLATADTSLLKRVPGIGSHFARKIAEHRRRLGGFVSIDQLNDIELFPKEAKRFFTLSSTTGVARLNINKLSLAELRQHPYINYYQARAITELRRKNGPLKSIDDLRLSPYFPDDVRQQLAPYLTF
jgi:DNA uptake protein ComE-like DNA-binding protein